MTVTQTRNRLRQYLAYDGGDRVQLRSFLNTIADGLEEAAIFGGMVRDFSLGYARSFRSDIDIVTMSSANEIYNLIKHLNPIRNKFGGFRFVAGEHLFDIWCFHDTWAIQEGLIAGKRLDDLCKTTFFSLDAALYKLKEEQLIAGLDYEVHIKERVLGINLREHPDPARIAKRAIRMSLTKNLALTTELCDFIVRSTTADALGTRDASIILRMREHLKKAPNQAFKLQTQLPIWPANEGCKSRRSEVRREQRSGF